MLDWVVMLSAAKPLAVLLPSNEIPRCAQHDLNRWFGRISHCQGKRRDVTRVIRSIREQQQVVTAVGVLLSLRYDAVVILALAALGGFLTPVFIQPTGAGAGTGVNMGALRKICNWGRGLRK